MVPSQTFESFPVFSDTGTKVKPGDAKYSAGFQQSDVLPAEWVNWEWNKASKGVTDLNTGLTSVEAEINSVLTGAGKSPDATKTNQLLESIAKLIDDAETRAKLAAHPIGSLYWSSNSTDPGTLFGGTWAAIKDCFVWAKGDSDTVNATGGAKTVTLLTENLPSHSHTIGGNTGGESSHTHSLNDHTHSFSGSQSHGHAILARSAYNNTEGNCVSAGSNTKGDGLGGPSSQTANTQSYYTYFRNDSTKSRFIQQSTVTISGTTGKSSGSTGSGTSHNHTLPANTGSTGSGTAVDKMPPYTVKYCWERTA